MATAIWAAGASLLGVLIGGWLSLLAQGRADRSASRRFAATIREGRRVERVIHLINFLETSQEAERLAVSQHRHSRTGPEWAERIDAILDQLWARLRAVQLLCPLRVRKAAREYTWRIHRVLREELKEVPGGKSVAEFLHDGREELLEAARHDLDRVDVEGTMGADGLA